MTHSDFDKLQTNLFLKSKEVRQTKGKEYANSSDALANFKRLAVELDIHPTSVAFIYFKKHLDSITHYIKSNQPGSEPIEGRIVDAITYLTLIYALIKETSKDEM